MGRLFGTDGIRGLANQYPVDAETALRVGRAAAEVMGKGAAAAAPAVIGQDTRISGDMLAQAAAAGILSTGMGAVRVGVLPTPAVAHLVASTGAPLGIMISASHNPFEDNGIKIFDAAGFKIDDRLENEIENQLFDVTSRLTSPPTEPAGMSRPLQDPLEAYRRFLVLAGRAAGTLEGLDLVLDCANGAASSLAPLVFADLGARVTVTAARPDGCNINAGCGSEHPQDLARKVVQIGAHAGLAFDGDGDRMVAVDETGQVLTGDQSIAILARDMDRRKALVPRCVVTTVMSNLGLGLALRSLGISHHTSDVGDRRVMETMRRTGAVLGGEDSGHIILRGLHTTGDGILSGLRLMGVVASSGKPLSELARVMTVHPQVLMAVDVRTKPPLAELEGVMRQVAAVEKELAGQGRVLVRYSGTQPVCRVMVEGAHPGKTASMCRRIADAVRKAVG